MKNIKLQIYPKEIGLIIIYLYLFLFEALALGPKTNNFFNKTNKKNPPAHFFREIRPMPPTLYPVTIGKNDYLLAKETSLSIVMTDFCNAKCPFCINELGFKNCGEAVAKNFAKKINRAIKIFNVKDVVLLGGEPLTSKHLGLILNELDKVKNQLDEITITTNGILLRNKRIMDMILKSSVSSVNISYHHYNHAKNNEIMKANTLTLDEISSINKILMFHGKTLRLNITAFKGGLDNSEKLNKFAEIFGAEVDAIKVNPVYPTKSYGTTNKVSMFTEKNSFSKDEWTNIITQFSSNGEILTVHKDIFGVTRTVVRLPSGLKVLLVTPYTDNKKSHEIRSIKLLSDGKLSLSWSSEGVDLMKTDVNKLTGDTTSFQGNLKVPHAAAFFTAA